MDVSMTPEQQAQVSQRIRDVLETSRTIIAAMLAVCIWDWLVTLHTEIIHVWRSPLSVVNVAFFVNRYGNLAVLSMICYMFYWQDRTYEWCQHVYRLETYLPVLVYLAAEVVVIARVYAIWGKNKVILYGLSMLLAAQIGVQCWLPVYAAAYALPPGVFGCIPKDTAGLFQYYYVAVMVFEAVVFALMLYKTAHMYLNKGNNVITMVLLRDQVFFYGLSLAANLANVMYLFMSGPMDNSAMLSPLAQGILSISSSRILLNLRSASASPRKTSNAAPGRMTPTPSVLHITNNTSIRFPESDSDTSVVQSRPTTSEGEKLGKSRRHPDSPV